MHTAQSTVLSLMLVTATLGLDAQTFSLTPQTLAGWSVIGAPVSDLAQGQQLSLPAGAQLARPFVSGDIIVTLTSHPISGQTTQDWPVLELGAATVVFSRENTSGKLILSLGENGTLVTLPPTFKLDADGRWVDSNAITLARTGNQITVSAVGQSWSFPLGTPPGASQDVVLSAGAVAAWDLSSLEVVIPSATAQSTATTYQGTNSPSANASQTPQSAGSHGNGTTLSTAGPTTPGAAPAAAPASSTPTLELFTPPSVRYGRADAVRAILSQSGNKGGTHP